MNRHQQIINEIDELKAKQEASKEFYDSRIAEKQRELNSCPSMQCSATEAWCRLTNALIDKYKHLAEENPEKAIKEITQIEGCLITGGYLTQKQLEEAL